MRVLSVDDSAIDLRVMNRFLQNHHECVLAKDGLEAIDKFEKSINDNKPFDLILLDIVMPNLDGISALKVIRTLEKSKAIVASKIILVSSIEESSENFSIPSNLFYDGYVLKPMTLEKLDEILNNLNLINPNRPTR